MRKIPCILISTFLILHVPLLHAQEADSTKKEIIEQLTYKQQPGLAMAASKIFFAEKRWSVSGFGEANWVNYQGDKNINSGDIELFYTNLYRYAMFFGYRFSDKIIWNSEAQIEYLHDGTRESRTEFIIEAFLDFLFSKAIKARIGFYPLTIGYVNNNDEPVMFYSVNRSEVERLIIPSSWIELGALLYGNITNDLSYAVGLSQGVNAQHFLGGTWIRQGREIRFDIPKALSINPQLTYTGFENVTLSTSAYIGNSGQGKTIIKDGVETDVKARINLYTGYFKFEKDNLRFVSIGALGRLSETENIFHLTETLEGEGQVLGRKTYGYLAELGYDFLPLIRGKREVRDVKTKFYHTTTMKLPFFVRFERLNTHRDIAESLIPAPRIQNDLTIWTVGMNFNTRENIVFKANYQFRNNKYTNALIPKESDFIEFGFGFIF